jgi:hypothetical protein
LEQLTRVLDEMLQVLAGSDIHSGQQAALVNAQGERTKVRLNYWEVLDLVK